MTDVIVVGDGPGGLSAALFLAKNDMSVTVFGQDETLMHKALLYNYLGIPKISGPEFQKISREQVRGFGGEIRDVEVSSAEKGDAGFEVKTADGQSHQAQYLILATGPANPLATGRGGSRISPASRICKRVPLRSATYRSAPWTARPAGSSRPVAITVRSSGDAG